ncbi:N-acetylmannosaminyltransferase [Acidisarcina polymorpha]|uniref:N-acetylmannosaminyltransferase n=2 Tax=Acidisarcina polymorpha TaxID=2211140 RepID=A0A2Z5G6M6_9BACT|nr:N-acetylmannosaminyltransferase [Acidisarcina polymorpha]
MIGVPIDNVSMDEAVEAIENGIHEGGFHHIATANVDFLITSIHDQELKDILAACYLVLPDGMPLVWASRMMRSALRERVSGADLVPKIAELSADRGYGIFLLGSCEASSEGAAEWMALSYPGVRIVGRCCPEIQDLDEMDHERILLQIEAAKPDILLVALGSPKQEKWLAMHSHRLKVPVCIGIGGSLDILAGMLRRAPLWMQRQGLEWFFRTCQEPARLGARYLRDALGMVVYMALQLAASAAQKPGHWMNGVVMEEIGSTTILRISGRLTGTPVANFEEEARLAVRTGRHLILDLARTTFIGPDALGELIHLAYTAKKYQREFWLTGLGPSLLRLIQAAQLKSNFRIAPKASDALRRIPATEERMSIESGKDWALCRVGGRLIPLEREVAAGVCRQVLQMIERRPHEMARDHREPVAQG